MGKKDVAFYMLEGMIGGVVLARSGLTDPIELMELTKVFGAYYAIKVLTSNVGLLQAWEDFVIDTNVAAMEAGLDD